MSIAIQQNNYIYDLYLNSGGRLIEPRKNFSLKLKRSNEKTQGGSYLGLKVRCKVLWWPTLLVLAALKK